MNMNDLKVMAAQKAGMVANEFTDLPEDSPELKTPTAEDIMVPEQKVSTLQRKLWFEFSFLHV